MQHKSNAPGDIRRSARMPNGAIIKKIIIIFLSGFIVIGTGCNSLSQNPTQITKISTEEISHTKTPISKSSPTTIENTVCEVVTKSSTFQLLSNKLVLSNWSDLEIVDPRTGENATLTMPNQKIYFPVISPQGKFLAFLQTYSSNQNQKVERLVIMSSDGSIIKEMEWDDSWEKLGFWLDEQNIIVKYPRSPSSTLNSLLVLNVFTGSMRVLLPDFPQIEDLTRLLWSNSGKTIYNQSISDVVYPTLGEKGQAYILWDLTKNRITAELPTHDFSQDGPHWSPLNNGFAIVATGDSDLLGNNEFFWISQEGAISQITSFRSKYSSIDIRKWSWSPNGQFIAFWYQPGYQGSEGLIQTYSLGLLDLTTGKVENFCITSLLNFLQEPVWSGDSRVVALNLTNDNEKENQVVLLDLQNHTTLFIAQHMYPVGWLSPENSK